MKTAENSFNVQIGQVWKDNDKRTGQRLVRVEAIEDGRARCRLIDTGTFRQVNLSRFDARRATGYTLMEG